MSISFFQALDGPFPCPYKSGEKQNWSKEKAQSAKTAATRAANRATMAGSLRCWREHFVDRSSCR